MAASEYPVRILGIPTTVGEKNPADLLLPRRSCRVDAVPTALSRKAAGLARKTCRSKMAECSTSALLKLSIAWQRNAEMANAVRPVCIHTAHADRYVLHQRPSGTY